jgi:membrane-bound lytic murein transglycosylase D
LGSLWALLLPEQVRRTQATGLLIRRVTAPVASDLPVVVNEPVQRFVRFFTGAHADEFALYWKRSGRYEGMIRAKLRQHGLPEDLVYLSLVESGFNPTARSPAQAVGLWQFMAATARRYGLRVDAYVDERRDPERSTDAALRYLRDLYEEFGAWHLAAAAYNSGENRVRRLLREELGRERGTELDYWRIRHRLPKETRDYVPQLIAATLIGKQPARYGLAGVERYDPVATVAVAVPGAVPLAVVARAIGVPSADLERLNPALVRRQTPPDAPAYPVRIPFERRERFATAFPTALERWRAEMRRERELEARLAAAKAAEARAGKATTTRGPRVHVVRRGESLWTIAQRYGVSVASLRRANHVRGAALRPGTRLRIPRA